MTDKFGQVLLRERHSFLAEQKLLDFTSTFRVCQRILSLEQLTALRLTHCLLLNGVSGCFGLF